MTRTPPPVPQDGDTVIAGGLCLRIVHATHDRGAWLSNGSWAPPERMVPAGPGAWTLKEST